MDVDDLSSVAEAARLTGLSERRVRALIADGQLPARRVLGRWAVPTEELHRFRRYPAGRPLSQQSAWALLSHLAGDTTAADVPTPTRLHQRLTRLEESPDPENLLMRWTRTRSTPLQRITTTADIRDLLGDDRVILTGHLALTPYADDTERLQIYAQETDLDDLCADYHLQPADAHKADQTVTLRTVDNRDFITRSPVNRHKAAAPVAALDILDTTPHDRQAVQILHATIGAHIAASTPAKPPLVRRSTARRPHPVAGSLDELRGPTSGTVRLPVTIDWGPTREYNVDDSQDAIRLYSRVLREAATAQELADYLNGPLLVRLWQSLNLTDEIAQQWQDRLPELAQYADNRAT
ncbi:MAG: helix-turn-helix domain-containing protein [Gordonia sp. (in: high G+C Gram-positive bacteria)]